MKWWLISEEAAKKVREALQASTHDANQFNCPDEGCYGCKGDAERLDALHVFETGMHLTNAVPDDYR